MSRDAIENWISHDGKGQPVADHIIVRVRFQLMKPSRLHHESGPDRADKYHWGRFSGSASGANIVAYQIIGEDAVRLKLRQPRIGHTEPKP